MDYIHTFWNVLTAFLLLLIGMVGGIRLRRAYEARTAKENSTAPVLLILSRDAPSTSTGLPLTSNSTIHFGNSGTFPRPERSD